MTIETNNVVERLAIALIADESSHLQLKFLREALKVCLSECELELVPASERQSLSDRIDVLEGAAAGMVSAWESLPGPKHYRFAQIQEWVSTKLKPAIDEVRASLTQGGKTDG